MNNLFIKITLLKIIQLIFKVCQTSYLNKHSYNICKHIELSMFINREHIFFNIRYDLKDPIDTLLQPQSTAIAKKTLCIDIKLRTTPVVLQHKYYCLYENTYVYDVRFICPIQRVFLCNSKLALRR